MEMQSEYIGHWCMVKPKLDIYGRSNNQIIFFYKYGQIFSIHFQPKLGMGVK